jgi:hypothetical protein
MSETSTELHQLRAYRDRNLQLGLELGQILGAGDDGVDLRTLARELKAKRETLAHVTAALTDTTLTDGAKVVAAMTYLGGLEPPTAGDIAWALSKLKEAAAQGRVEIGNTARLQHETRPQQERTATLQAFDRETHVGLLIQWSELGVGFGEITIAVSRLTGKCTIDTEEMGPEFCSRIFHELAKRFAP